MTAQRIVLTSPWKLGLFVFLLVAGTGFGLLYAYIEVFGGQLKEVVTNAQSLDERITLSGSLTIRDAYIVLGAIALLSLVGYIAVVGSARPLDRVVRGGRKREQALKRLEATQDPREADAEDFQEEPAIAHLLDRWTRDVQRASDLELMATAQREAIATLTLQLREAPTGDFTLRADTDDPTLNSLIASINGFVHETAQAAEEASASVRTERDPSQPSVALAIGTAVHGLSVAEGELTDFVASVAKHAERIAQVAQRLAQTDASGAMAPVGAVFDSAQRTGDRLHQLRATLEALAEHTNKLAITMALQVNRLGEAGSPLIETAEELRSMSTRYQRLAADLRVCETDHASTLQALQGIGAQAAQNDSGALTHLRQEAMILDQNAEALREVLGQLQRPLGQLRAVVGEPEPPRSAAHAVPPVSRPISVIAPHVAEAASGERVFEIAELGGQLIPGDDDANVYDLEALGAVRI